MAQLSNCIQLTINFVTLLIYCDISCRSHNTFHTTFTDYHAWRVQASSHFARRYSGNHYYFLFVLLLRCFSSQAFLRYDYLIHHRIVRYKPYRVSPFGILGIKGFQRLPRAYRSFTRPSSAVGTKASTVSSLQLYLTYSRILTLFCSCGYFASASLSRLHCSIILRRISIVTQLPCSSQVNWLHSGLRIDYIGYLTCNNMS